MKRIAIAALIASAALAGCSTPTTYGPSVGESKTYGLQRAETGEILSVRNVTIQPDNKGGWTLVGAIAGGIAGNALGNGSGKTLATIGGALAGGVAGHQADKATGGKPGVEVSVKTPRGRRYVVIQEDQGEGFRPGETVNVVFAKGYSRVVR